MRHSKNNKGFSLVELIIVMAILVALVAVLAPAYLRYVERSRDAVLSNCAEDILHAANGEYAMGHLTGEGKIIIKAGPDRLLLIEMNKNPDGTDDASSALVYDNGENDDTFADLCGIDDTKEIKSDKVFIITIDSKSGAPHISNPEDANIEMTMQDPDGD
jgi:prepilin-type N-terminal cleavage/methylation domain-containing protein